ncbi:MAG: rhodanese-like domain-containing protein [Massilioclostridium sp.]|nr:rhodanese-like domain-containing protein [Massilioclostridium sp.]
MRRADEYAQKHIPGARLAPNETIGNQKSRLLPDKDVVLLIHCRAGVRSRQATEKLVALGYKCL